MKKHLAVIFLIMLFALTLTSCMPPGYTNARAKSITKEHAHEAKDWFKANLPEAKVKSAQAYSDVSNLFAAISGEYSLNGLKYEYIYDYYNGQMYLEYEYRKAEQVANQLMADYIGLDVNGFELRVPEYSFQTFCENDKGGKAKNSAQYGSTITASGLELLPAGSNPQEYGKLMLYDGFGDSGSLEVYSDTLPDYDPAFFKQFAGITSVSYSVVADYEYDDLYKVMYRPDEANYYHLRITKLSDDLYGGYTYTITDTYDENGELIQHQDPSGTYDPSTLYTENTDGSFALNIPSEHARILLFAPKGTYYNLRRTANGEEKKIKLDRWNSSPYKYKTDYEYFKDDIVLPKSKLALYTCLSTNGSKYHILTK